MAKVGAQRAAELTGKSKSTIQRAINNGKISFEKDSSGRRVIDVSELERVYGLKKSSMVAEAPVEVSTDNAIQHELEKAKNMLETERMRMRIKMLEDQVHSLQKQLDDMGSQRDKWQQQSQQLLITSEYTQKQAEEFKAEIVARKERDEARRKAAQALKMKKLAEQNNVQENENLSVWQKIKDKVSA
ncbi:MAG: helix-turn-helix domain-containing protein [Pseudomonadota bacterium]|nr:helix-turn-helix domain-containing protein [Pseudomonadota bacterium]